MFKFGFYTITLFVLISSCSQTNKESAVLKNQDTACDYNCLDFKYIESVFTPINKLELSHSNRSKLMKYVKQKLSKTVKPLSRSFTDKYICENSNICYGKEYKIDYYPLGRFNVGNFYILAYEKYENRFPIMFKESYAVIFDKKKCTILDKLLIYRDYNIGISNCAEINCILNKDSISITYRECLSFDPEKEEQKYYKLFKITVETLKMTYDGKFELSKSSSKTLFFDEMSQKWL